MNYFSRKAPTLLFIGLLVSLFVLAWLFPAAGPGLGMAFLALSLGIASFFIVQEHRAAYRQGRITGRTFLQNVAVEITSVGLAMVLAGLLGRAVAARVTEQIGDALVRFLAGGMIGLVAGLAAGFFLNRVFVGRLVR
jgi:hypothetical protein